MADPGKGSGQGGPPGGQTLLLIDGNSLVHRAYHALPALATRDGQPTQAVYGFTRMLLKVLKQEAPGRAVVAFDRGQPRARMELLAAYKGNRPPADDDLKSQFPLVKEVVAALGLAICEVEGFEADDLIGTLAAQAEAAGWRVLLLTGDRDLLQLVTGRTTALLTRKGITELEPFDPAKVREVLGVEPRQIPDLKALVGDTSDNIPGVPGIGPKSAGALLERFSHLEGIFCHLEELPPATRRRLQEHWEQALVARRVATIERGAPVRLDEVLAAGRPREPRRLEELFTRLEFRGLLQEVRGAAGGGGGNGERPAPVVVDTPRPAPLEIGARGTAGVASPAGHEELERVTSRAGLEAWLAGLGRPAALTVFPVLDHPEPMRARLVALALSDGRRRLLARGEGAALAPLGPLLADSRVSVAGHDLKPLWVAALREGLRPGRPGFDLLLAGYLLQAGSPALALEQLAFRYLGESAPTWEERARACGVRGARSPADLPGSELEALLARRLELFPALRQALEERLAEYSLQSLLAEVEIPLLPVLAEMEYHGVAVDAPALRAMSQAMEGRLAAMTERIYRLAGERFNVNSPRQLAEVLYGKLGLPVLKRTKTGPSTSAEVLEALAPLHEVVASLLEYRQIVKLKSTYVDVLPGLIHPQTGRVHTSFQQAVAATGRLSSVAPNLQNIPVRTEEGRQIRRAFVARPGHCLVTADYSQIELRILAHLSGDPQLVEVFRRGEDIHTRTASEVFGVPPEAVSPAQRSHAKMVSFGILYGISSFGLAQGTGLSQEEAQRYIDTYFRRYPGVKEYLDDLVRQARQKGYVTTLLGRRRELPEIRSRKYAARAFAERTAVNTPMQGSAADIIKLAMLRVRERLAREGLAARMILQVHDELVFEAPEAEKEVLAALVKEEMEAAYPLQVPLEVEVKAGPNWGEAAPLAVG